MRDRQASIEEGEEELDDKSRVLEGAEMDDKKA